MLYDVLDSEDFLVGEGGESARSLFDLRVRPFRRLLKDFVE